MTTTYKSNHAITVFASQQELLQFIAHPDGIVLMEVDYKYLFVKWKF